MHNTKDKNGNGTDGQLKSERLRNGIVLEIVTSWLGVCSGYQLRVSFPRTLLWFRLEPQTHILHEQVSGDDDLQVLFRLVRTELRKWQDWDDEKVEQFVEKMQPVYGPVA